MKLLLENWRKFLNEEVKLQGILKLTPTPEVVAQAKDIMQTLPPEAVPLPDEKATCHSRSSKCFKAI